MDFIYSALHYLGVGFLWIAVAICTLLCFYFMFKCNQNLGASEVNSRLISIGEGNFKESIMTKVRAALWGILMVGAGAAAIWMGIIAYKSKPPEPTAPVEVQQTETAPQNSEEPQNQQSTPQVQENNEQQK